MLSTWSNTVRGPRVTVDAVEAIANGAREETTKTEIKRAATEPFNAMTERFLNLRLVQQ
jgi:hypothetical protein